MAQIEWRAKRIGKHSDKIKFNLYADDWYLGEVYPTADGEWTTLCQLTRKGNMVPCEQAVFATAQDARQALEEQAVVVFIGTNAEERKELSFKVGDRGHDPA